MAILINMNGPAVRGVGAAMAVREIDFIPLHPRVLSSRGIKIATDAF